MTGRWILCALIVGSVGVVGTAQEAAKGNVWSNLDVQLYGFIKTDAAWDDSRTTAGNFVKWVDSETGTPDVSAGTATRNDEQFNLTANETRFGFKIKAPQTGKYEFSGQMEWDLYGESTVSNQNKAELMTRHAFITMKDVDAGWSLLAGQTWDVVAPLNPRTLNYSVMWWGGNIGYRRPQIRLSKTYEMGNGQSFSVAGALARTGGTSTDFTTDTGADKGYPMLQGRAAWTFPLIDGLGTTVGVSGHYGEEEYDSSTPTQAETVQTWSGAVDVTVPVCEGLAFKGEIYTGANLSALLGGVGHGVDDKAATTGPEEVHNSGGWVAASIDPDNKWSYNTGYGYSENSNGDLLDGSRLTNSCLFANAIHDFNKHASAGIEVSRWLTEYRDSADGEAWRVQLSLILKN